MPLFVCAKCKCVENTALGLWWTREIMKDDYVWTTVNIAYKGKGLCSECAPEMCTDGSTTRYGYWHNQFEKEHYKESGIPETELMQLP